LVLSALVAGVSSQSTARRTGINPTGGSLHKNADQLADARSSLLTKIRPVRMDTVRS
jgi:hypothetical protein